MAPPVNRPGRYSFTAKSKPQVQPRGQLKRTASRSVHDAVVRSKGSSSNPILSTLSKLPRTGADFVKSKFAFSQHVTEDLTRYFKDMWRSFGQPHREFKVRINFAHNAKRGALTAYSQKVLTEIMAASGNRSIMITRTQSSFMEQARIMYDNLIRRGIAHELRMYSSIGDQVVEVAASGIKDGLSKNEIIQNMASKISELEDQGTTVSKHLGDYNTLNVIDIDPISVEYPSAFIREVKRRGIKLIQPPIDPAYHLEIKQTPVNYV
ncbi:hypothetical protein LJ737_15240 [Hymenobacter sp. 15J16-1T3B]|uniref:hypothetical protein n=1 Tax=Hymenobacter sp. 15J16-1T3B TaxID=2886941 RepID=UPI001D11FC88|nr:hypothetical protein [Hymenobacter sp. 15J16-1T3B]MCC3158603.1 hypothetical protein [Hymenobacter sp. 15J16-1T3B]